MATVVTPMTTETLLALPYDGVRRWLVDGELREESVSESPMTLRNRFHSRLTTVVSTELEVWLRQQPKPRGQVLSGEAGVRLRRDPDTTAGIDVVYVSPEVMAAQTEETTLIEGVPTLVVEILAPGNPEEDVREKFGLYRKVGVPLVWVIDPHAASVRVYRAGGESVLFDAGQELTAEPHLPGLRVPVARLFE